VSAGVSRWLLASSIPAWMTFPTRFRGATDRFAGFGSRSIPVSELFYHH
jgi:hypothetical protein